MTYICDNCGKDALPTDTVCWHCGAKLPKWETPSPTESKPENETAPLDLKKTVMYGSFTIIILILLLAVMGSMGQRPLFITTDATQLLPEWTAVTSADFSYTVNLPPDWQWLDREEAEQREMADLFFVEKSELQTAVDPFANLANDTRLLSLAYKEPETSEEWPAFITVIRSDNLNEWTQPQIVGSLRNELGEGLLRYEVEDTFYGREKIDFRLRLYDELTAVELRCIQHLIPSQTQTYIIAACTPEDSYTANATEIFSILASFQPLER